MLHADRFCAAIRQIADLAAWRERQKAAPAEWWYLDVLAYVPAVLRAPMAAPRQPELLGAE